MKKYKFFKCILSVGDGANDLNMLNHSDISVGIFGKNPLLIHYNVDYIIGDFNQLVKLIFVFGSENFRKNKKIIEIFFYCGFLLIIPKFYYAMFNHFNFINLYYYLLEFIF